MTGITLYDTKTGKASEVTPAAAEAAIAAGTLAPQKAQKIAIHLADGRDWDIEGWELADALSHGAHIIEPEAQRQQRATAPNNENIAIGVSLAIVAAVILGVVLGVVWLVKTAKGKVREHKQLAELDRLRVERRMLELMAEFQDCPAREIAQLVRDEMVNMRIMSGPAFDWATPATAERLARTIALERSRAIGPHEPLGRDR